VGGIHVHGSSGDDMGELTETGIADAFERIALELGQ
jgi:hypothetical protein